MRNEYKKIYEKLKEQAPHRNYEWFQPAWCGGYTEVKFCDANDPDIGLANLVRNIYNAF